MHDATHDGDYTTGSLLRSRFLGSQKTAAKETTCGVISIVCCIMHAETFSGIFIFKRTVNHIIMKMLNIGIRRLLFK